MSKTIETDIVLPISVVETKVYGDIFRYKTIVSTSGTTQYIGKAEHGTLDSESKWTIYKTTYNNVGKKQSTTTLVNQKWNDYK